MAEATGKGTNYAVMWSIPGEPHHRFSTVTIIDGYTTVEAIPRILACKHLGGDVNRAAEITVHSAEPHMTDQELTDWFTLRGVAGDSLPAYVAEYRGWTRAGLEDLYAQMHDC